MGNGDDSAGSASLMCSERVFFPSLWSCDGMFVLGVVGIRRIDIFVDLGGVTQRSV